MKSKSLSLYEIALNEEEYVKDASSEAFETLFSIIDELDGVLPLYEGVEFDDEKFIPLYSSYSFIESALLHLDDLMDDILDSANRIYPLSKIEGIDKKEKKRIRELSGAAHLLLISLKHWRTSFQSARRSWKAITIRQSGQILLLKTIM